MSSNGSGSGDHERAFLAHTPHRKTNDTKYSIMSPADQQKVREKHSTGKSGKKMNGTSTSQNRTPQSKAGLNKGSDNTIDLKTQHDASRKMNTAEDGTETKRDKYNSEKISKEHTDVNRSDNRKLKDNINLQGKNINVPGKPYSEYYHSKGMSTIDIAKPHVPAHDKTTIKQSNLPDESTELHYEESKKAKYRAPTRNNCSTRDLSLSGKIDGLPKSPTSTIKKEIKKDVKSPPQREIGSSKELIDENNKLPSTRHSNMKKDMQNKKNADEGIEELKQKCTDAKSKRGNGKEKSCPIASQSTKPCPHTITTSTGQQNTALNTESVKDIPKQDINTKRRNITDSVQRGTHLKIQQDKTLRIQHKNVSAQQATTLKKDPRKEIAQQKTTLKDDPMKEITQQETALKDDPINDATQQDKTPSEGHIKENTQQYTTPSEGPIEEITQQDAYLLYDHMKEITQQDTTPSEGYIEEITQQDTAPSEGHIEEITQQDKAPSEGYIEEITQDTTPKEGYIEEITQDTTFKAQQDTTLNDEPIRDIIHEETTLSEGPVKDINQQDTTSKEGFVRDIAQQETTLKDTTLVKDITQQYTTVYQEPIKNIPKQETTLKDNLIKDISPRNTTPSDTTPKEGPMKDIIQQDIILGREPVRATLPQESHLITTAQHYTTPKEGGVIDKSQQDTTTRRDDVQQYKPIFDFTKFDAKKCNQPEYQTTDMHNLKLSLEEEKEGGYEKLKNERPGENIEVVRRPPKPLPKPKPHIYSKILMKYTPQETMDTKSANESVTTSRPKSKGTVKDRIIFFNKL